MKYRLYLGTLLPLALGLFGQGCQKPGKVALSPVQSVARNPMDFLKLGPVAFPTFFSLPKVQALVRQGNLKGASRYVNESICIEPRSPALHLLNAFIYESMLDGGQDDCRELVDIAYRTAMDLDPSLWLTHHLRGLTALKMSQYKKAQGYFADALALNPNHPEVTYALAYASYYAYDLPVALTFIEKAALLCPKKPEFIRSAAMICAAAGQRVKANAYLDAYKKLVGKTESDIGVMKLRLQQWSDSHSRAELMGSEASGITTRSNSDYSAFESKKSKDSQDTSSESVVFDVVLLSSSDQKNDSKGQNIFNSLQVTLGGQGGDSSSGDSKSDLVPQWTVRKASSTLAKLTASSSSSILAYSITPSAMQYSLNIANSGRSTVEISSRATLSTTIGHSAYFLQGQQFTGSTTGNLTGAATASIDAGMKVEIRPLSLSETGEIVLEITIVGSDFVNLPNSGLGISNQLVQVQRSKVSTTVKAQVGQTIMIGGIQTRQRTKTKSGFPLLQDIPLIQYFTSSAQTSDNLASVIFLLTPRLGGGAPESLANIQNKRSMSSQLRKRGLMSIGEYSNTYYILKTLDKHGMFSQFQSGDLPCPVRAYDQKRLNEKLDQLRSFIWY
jgi:general secretion pathway protein D